LFESDLEDEELIELDIDEGLLTELSSTDESAPEPQDDDDLDFDIALGVRYRF
jgi:hypothetical protein